jgi:uncharacterized protein YjiS (DUF1127 family)
MASIIALHRTAGPRAGRAAPASSSRGLLGRARDAIAGAVRREFARRELLRLDDRQLRDIGLDRYDLLHPAERAGFPYGLGR